MGVVPAQAQPAAEVVLRNFGNVPKGGNPRWGVIRDSAGNLYGTAGGASNESQVYKGVVYKVDTAGHETVLYSFTGGADGGEPSSGVIRDPAGNFYGTTSDGGASGFGVVYKLDSACHETVLYSFTGGADGGSPSGGVVRDSAGNLYGTTAGGGEGERGVVYKLDTAGHQTVLYTFTGGADGGYPNSVILDSAGNLYGTTVAGGDVSPGYCSSGCGVVFMVNPAGQETVLYSFTGAYDGGYPYAGVVRDSAGNLYGTTAGGGEGEWGVVYKLDTEGQETVLWVFNGYDAVGAIPYAGVILDSAGNLYGTTAGGGLYSWGVVFKLDPAGDETVLYSFSNGSDGGGPEAGVILDSEGNLYGTTEEGGTATLGVVYKLDSANQETVLYSFQGATGGSFPNAGVIRDLAGNLYGTTEFGGPDNAGVVYRMNADGQETVLYNFTGGADGGHPEAGVIRDSAGNLYGTTTEGGSGYGVVYKLDASGQETVLYKFMDQLDGGRPYAGVIRDSAGNLYGTTVEGGSFLSGVVYKLNTTGQETVLYSFTGGTDGSGPDAGLVLDSAGNLYGTTSYGGAGYGVVFKVNAASQYSVLYTFTGGADGAYPLASVIRDSAGNLYGTTSGGGMANDGVVYKVDTTGHETALYSFTGAADGGYPEAGVIRDSAGNLYGTTFEGGDSGSNCYIYNGCGMVYKLNTAGDLIVLYTFTGGADGAQPYAGVIGDSECNLYGTTGFGGSESAGVVFKLTPH
jgi:uncharacterized repeat protein (TIGR03803 family)